jgi:CRISPR-associated protein Cas2
MTGSQAGRTLYVIAYDIPNDRRRTKVLKTLRGFGKWTQFSVFECFLSAKELVLLHERLRKQIRPDEDSVRFYPLCQTCCGKVESVGGPKPEDPVTVIV